MTSDIGTTTKHFYPHDVFYEGKLILLIQVDDVYFKGEMKTRLWLKFKDKMLPWTLLGEVYFGTLWMFNESELL